MAWAGSVLVLGMAVCLSACAVPGVEDAGGFGYADEGTVVDVPRRRHRDTEPVICHGCGRPEHRDHQEHREHRDHPHPQPAHARPPERHHEHHHGGGGHKSEKSEKKKS